MIRHILRPAKSVAWHHAVTTRLCSFMQRVARVVVQSPLNSAHIPVAYTRLERLLAHLEALSGSLPACYEAHHGIYRYATLAPSAYQFLDGMTFLLVICLGCRARWTACQCPRAVTRQHANRLRLGNCWMSHVGPSDAAVVHQCEGCCSG